MCRSDAKAQTALENALQSSTEAALLNADRDAASSYLMSEDPEDDGTASESLQLCAKVRNTLPMRAQCC